MSPFLSSVTAGFSGKVTAGGGAPFGSAEAEDGTSGRDVSAGSDLRRLRSPLLRSFEEEEALRLTATV